MWLRRLSPGAIVGILAGAGLIGISVGVELVSSAPNGIGPYQTVLIVLGGLVILLSVIPSDRVASKITLLCLSFVVSMMLIEGLLLVLSRSNVTVTFPDTRELLDDEVLGKRTPSDAVGHDSRGWRNETALEQADIVVIGDSQTWGVNVPLSDTYPSVLSNLLGDSVYSMAQGSYGAVQYRVLSEEAIELSPQLVVIGMYFGNDLADAYSIVYGDYVYEDLRDPTFDLSAITQTIAERSEHLVPDGLTNLNRQSVNRDSSQLNLWERFQAETYIGKFLTSLGVFQAVDTGAVEERMKMNRDIVSASPELFDFYQDEHVQTYFTSAYRQLVVDTNSPIIQEGIRISKDQFLEISDLLSDAKVDLIVALIPTKELVYAPYLDAPNNAHRLLAEQETDIRVDMMNFFDTHAIDYVDTLPALQSAVEEGIAIYTPTFDGHPASAGYHVIAETIADYIRENDVMK